MSRIAPPKAALRSQLQASLAKLDEETVRAGSAAVARKVMALPEIGAGQHVLVCLSFGVELDTWSLLEIMVREGVRVHVPRMVRRGRRLHIHPYPCPLERLSFGLQQPPKDAPTVPADTLDAALLLGLAYDRRGYRLGHGGGYFDRFLAQHDLLAIGLGHDLQLLESLPTEEHDVPLHRVITPGESLNFAPG